jgi:hypothetical protein
MALEYFRFSRVFADGLDFPRGLAVADDMLFACNRQANEIQAYTVDGLAGGAFGASGAYLPNDITTDGDKLFVCWDSKHITVHDFAGGLLESISIADKEHPRSIAYSDNKVYIVCGDKIFFADVWALGVLELVTSYGIAPPFVNFPQGVAAIGDSAITADTFNKRANIYKGVTFAKSARISEAGQPVKISAYKGLIAVTDVIGGRVLFYDEDLTLQGIYDTEAVFIDSIAFYNDVAYISDSYTGRIYEYNIGIDEGGAYADTITEAARSLYPTGAAWKMPIGGNFYALHNAASLALSRVMAFAAQSRDYILPDTSAFNVEAAEIWERVYLLEGIGTLEDRRGAIAAAMSYPGSKLTRHALPDLLSLLQTAGFDVVIERCRVPVANFVATCGSSNVGSAVCGGRRVSKRFDRLEPEAGWAQIVANSLDPAADLNHLTEIDMERQLRSAFKVYVTDVTTERIKELRHLILKYKPAYTVVFLYFN